MSDRPTPEQQRFRHRKALRDNADAARIDRLWLRVRASRRGGRHARGTGRLVAAAMVLGLALGAGVGARRPAMLRASLLRHDDGAQKQLLAVMAAGTVARIVALPGGGWARLGPETIVVREPGANGEAGLQLLRGELTLLADPVAGGGAPRLRVGDVTALQLHGRLRARKQDEAAELQLLAGGALLRRARPQAGEKRGAGASIVDEPLVAGRIVPIEVASPAAQRRAAKPLPRAQRRDASSPDPGTAPEMLDGHTNDWRTACKQDDYAGALRLYSAQPQDARQLTAAELACLELGHIAKGNLAAAAQLDQQILQWYPHSTQAIAAALWLSGYYRRNQQPDLATQYESLYQQMRRRQPSP